MLNLSFRCCYHRGGVESHRCYFINIIRFLQWLTLQCSSNLTFGSYAYLNYFVMLNELFTLSVFALNLTLVAE